MNKNEKFIFNFVIRTKKKFGKYIFSLATFQNKQKDHNY